MPEKTIAGANVRIAYDEKCNIVRILELADKAGAMGVDILVLPKIALQDVLSISDLPTPTRVWHRDRA